MNYALIKLKSEIGWQLAKSPFGAGLAQLSPYIAAWRRFYLALGG